MRSYLLFVRVSRRKPKNCIPTVRSMSEAVATRIDEQISSQKEDLMTIHNTTADVVQIDYDAYNDHSFDAHWLERAAAPIDEECEVVDVPSSGTLRGPEGLKQFLLGV